MSNQTIPQQWRSPRPVQQPKYSVSGGLIFKRILNLIFQPLGLANCRQKIELGTVSSSVPAQSFSLGKFTVNWQDSGRKQFSLQISHNNKIIWETPPGKNFIGGANVELNIVENRGSVEIDETYLTQFSHQTVTHIEQEGNTLILCGVLETKSSLVNRIISLLLRRHFPAKSIKYILSLQVAGENKLDFDLELIGKQANQAQLSYVTSAAEHFYGFGEQFSDVDCKGHVVPIVCEEGGIGRGDIGPKFLTVLGVSGDRFSSYAPVPHFLTNKGRSLFLTNTEPSVFDLRNPDLVKIRIESSRMQGQLLCGESPLELIELYTEYTGRMAPLPNWLNSGALIGMQGGTEKVRETWLKLRKFDTPIAGFWLQDWVGQRPTIAGQQLWWNWQLDRNRYPKWDLLVKELEQAGIAVGVYLNPFLIELAPEQIAQKYDSWRNLFQEAKTQGFLVTKENGEPYLVQNTDFDAGLVDWSNPQATAWFKEIIKTEILGTIGAKFWMADFGEAAQFDGKFYCQQSGLTYHNQYPVDWANVNRAAIQEANRQGDAWFFTRAGYSKTPGMTTGMWLGDQNVTWKPNDGLPSSLTGLLSSGFSGFSLNHSDIGGYTSIGNPILRFFGRGFVRSRELLFRWMEMNAFTPIFRTHEGNEPDKNVQFYDDSETLATFSYWAKVYAAFADYRIKLMEEAATKGYPLIRHLVLHYPDDENVYELEDQFLYGSEFLVKPVLKKGQTSVDVYFPAGEWVHLWSNKTYSNSSGKGKITISAPMGRPAVFYRQNSPEAKSVLETLQQ
ncbi:MAG: alpha-glucosidase, partial [Calothrix sp. MO_167.B12]|nr:alpha-glucosidase [Calothrix sp. MO_167.B12]